MGKWSVLWQEIGPEVQDSAGNGADGAKQGISTGAMSNDLTSDAIFLFIKGEGGKGGRHDGCLGCSEQVQLGGTCKQLNIFELKRCRFRRADGVFTWPEEKEERNADHI